MHFYLYLPSVAVNLIRSFSPMDEVPAQSRSPRREQLVLVDYDADSTSSKMVVVTSYLKEELC